MPVNTNATPVDNQSATAVFATDPVLTAMNAMLSQPETLVETAMTAASSESPDFIRGFLAALDLSGLADLRRLFLSVVLATCTRDITGFVSDPALTGGVA